MSEARIAYIATGGNRHPASADWEADVLAYGASNNIAVWNPNDAQHAGIQALLQGHKKVVNAVRVLRTQGILYIISGAGDNLVKVWRARNDKDFEEWQTLSEHHASINTISTLQGQSTFSSASVDGVVHLWQINDTDVTLLQSITVKPKYIPLTTALVALDNDAIVLAVAGTTTSIQLYAGPIGHLTLQATLTGHEGWIRSLDFQCYSNGKTVLASTSQDRFVRLWQVQHSTSVPDRLSVESLSNKIYQLRSGEHLWTVAYDALLVGHEDWVYSARWAPALSDGEAALLTSSADNSLSIWQREASSGVWICETRLGEISSLKGSTTATGSTGGFWNGLWSPDGSSVVSLSGTGSWRKWTTSTSGWQQKNGVGGHVKEVQSLVWAGDGSYLLSTSLDQTTRLWAEWKRGSETSWHEMARPQIHGYDLNCIACVTNNQFISGAEEKLLRVFNKPRGAQQLLRSLAGLSIDDTDLPNAADIPVLGLSNKAIVPAEDDKPQEETTFEQPPLEDALARLTLWPEHEKLYGHGYEISALAVSHDGTIAATACKASTLDHAVIRLYETEEWREVKPPLAAHTLTVTSLAFSRDDNYLLSVGRDRQWALFKRAEGTYEAHTMNPKSHSRMVLACSWASDSIFATAGRDKVIKVWQVVGDSFEQLMAAPSSTSVTAVAFSPDGDRLLFGTEDGELVLLVSKDSWKSANAVALPHSLRPSAAVTSIAWRPTDDSTVAVASGDTAVRLYTLRSYAT